MNQKVVEALASLLKTTPEKISAEFEKETGVDLVKQFTDNNTIYTNPDFETFKTNFKAEVEREWAEGTVPNSIYNKVKGASLEVKSKELAKKHGIDQYNDMDDLVGKIIDKSVENPLEVSQLKSQIDKLVGDHATEVEQLRSQNKARFIDHEINRVINALPIDAEGTVLDNQKEIVYNMIKAKFEFDMNGDNVVINKAPVDIKKPNLDPRPMTEVFTDFAKNYVNISSPETGGRGGSSSVGKPSTVSMREYAKANNILPNSPAHYEAIKKFREQGVEITE